MIQSASEVSDQELKESESDIEETIGFFLLMWYNKASLYKWGAMMNKELYLKNIANSLGLLSKQASIHNAINFYDINIAAESFYSGLRGKSKGTK